MTEIEKLLPAGEIRLYKQSAGLARYQGTLVASWCGHMKRYFDNTYGDIWMYWHKGELALWVFNEDQMHMIAQEMLQKSKVSLPSRFQEDWPRLQVEIERISRGIRRLDLVKLSNEELSTWYERMLEAHRNFWSLGIFIDSFDAGEDTAEIARITSEHSFTPEEIQVLVTPHEPSYAFSWDKALFDVKERIRTPEVVVNEFYWIRTDYRSFEEVSKEFILEQAQAAHAPEWILSDGIERNLLETRGLSQNPLALFQTLTKWRDDRKRANFIGFYGLLRLLTEIGNRRGIEAPYMRNLLPQEARDMFHREPDPNIREQARTRFDTETFVRVKENGTYGFVDSSEAQAAYRMLEAHMPKSDKAELRGMVACRGISRGVAKIVPDMLSPSTRDFKAGDILVTSMTRPEFLPLMKLSGAIVTEEGGITSHAAIVSRELKKPCIIGVKHASEYLKDGDMVEVDADRGVVTILSK